MKIITFLLLGVLVLKIQPAASQNTELTRLVEQRKYTELQRRLANEKINKNTKKIYQSILLNVFGQAGKSNEMIEKVLKKNRPLADSIRFLLLQTQHDNFVKLFNYVKAYETKQFLLDRYSSFYKNETIKDEINVLSILKALKDEAPQTISGIKEQIVPITKNLIGLQTIPVSVDNSTYSFIFDTGAGFSTITDSMASVLKLKILDKELISIKGGVTGLGTNVKLGIAEAIRIGNIEVKNAVFLVFPDSSLTIDLKEEKFKLEPILGFPVIKELGSITVYTDKLQISDAGNNKSSQPNMAIVFLKPIIFLNYNGEDLPFTFDTGAGHSVLTEVFYNRFKNMVEQSGTAKTQVYGGAGGTKNFKVFALPSIQFMNFGDTITIRNIDVSTEKIATGNNVYYGNLGQDLIKQYPSMTINFRESWIKFNK